MSKIKHQFAGGRMNKDLDERIIPNGEYRDAMNIQVATSEDSEIGTVQNILSNHFITGQGYINDDAYCVGSVSDEKNDKAYFLISPKHIIEGVNINGLGGFQLGYQNLTTAPDDSWVFKNNKAVAAKASGTDFKKIFIPNVSSKLFENPDAEIEIRFKITDYVEGALDLHAYSNDGLSEIRINSITLSGEKDKDFVFRVKATERDTAITGYKLGSFYLVINSVFRGKVSDISVSVGKSLIVEHNVTNKQVSLVLVDINNDVLKFNQDRLITGINVIDGMMFFTDGYTEPKKINIDRCIRGTNQWKPTDDDGGLNLTTTTFTNFKASIQVPIREEHITVLKKKPTTAPNITVINERDTLEETFAGAFEPKVYSGIMRIGKDNSVNPILPGQDNFQNTSSFWLNPQGSAGGNKNHIFDFSSLSVGDIFFTRIETDINGNNDFELQWQGGDNILFKEFEGDNFDETPAVPITNYTVKAKIRGDYTWINDFTAGFPGSASADITTNDDFSLPNLAGTLPDNWQFFPGLTGIIEYNAATASVNFTMNTATQSNGWLYVKQTPSNTSLTPVGSPTSKERYKITVELDFNRDSSGNIVSSPGTLPNFTGGGHVNFVLHSDEFDADWGTNYNPGDRHVKRFPDSGELTAPGVYTEEFDLDLNDLNFLAGPNWVNNYAHGAHSFHTSGPGSTANHFSIKQLKIERVNVEDAKVALEVLDIKGTPPTVPQEKLNINFVADKEENKEKIFKFKFPRIAYRYRYQDGEYSALSPFSQPVFLTGSFDYDPKKGYNIGMVNRVEQIKVTNYNQYTPDGVVAIDLVFKEESSPNLYIIETIKPNVENDFWDDSAVTGFIIDNEQIQSAIESNQILRPYDNVPKTALAQEITGNRLVYGNYRQGYDLKIQDGAGTIIDINGNLVAESSQTDYYPDFQFDIIQTPQALSGTKRSIKSLREYQLGVVFVDEYGRETPVVSNKTGTLSIPKDRADDLNSFRISFNNDTPPLDLKYMKFYIKETSSEYYNLAMDRYYDSGDGGIWLSFPSAERNKVDIDDFLILKKGASSNTLIESEAKYKILDISNEAPEFIKDEILEIASQTHNLSASPNVVDLFGNNTNDAPLEGSNEFVIKYAPFSFKRTGSQLHTIKDAEIYVDFNNILTGGNSKKYRCTIIESDVNPPDLMPSAAFYTIKIEEPFGPDINFILNSAGSKVKDNIQIVFYRHKKTNLAKFDGKFFVKINRDSDTEQEFLSNALTSQLGNPKFRLLNERKLFSMARDHYSFHRSSLTGQTTGEYAKDFGRFAPFFRNYNISHGTHTGTDRLEPYEFGTKLTSGNTYYHQTLVAGTDNANILGSSNNNWIDIDNAVDGNNSGGTGGSLDPADWGGGAAWHVELAWFTGGSEFSYDIYAATPPGASATERHRLSSFSNAYHLIRKQNWKTADYHGWTRYQRNFNSVWFIDKGPFKGTRHWHGQSAHDQYNTAQATYWDGQPDTVNGNYRYFDSSGGAIGIDTPINTRDIRGKSFFQEGIFVPSGSPTTPSRIHIGIGAITHEDFVHATVSGSTPSTSSLDNFWNFTLSNNIGEYNSTSTEQKAKDTSDKFRSGFKFRFREDPSQEVYTIQQAVLKGRVRHTLGDGSNYSAYPSNYGARTGNQQDHFGYDWPATPGNVFPTNSNGPSTPTSLNWNANLNCSQVVEQYAPNFTADARLDILNSEGTNVMGWNPMETDYGGISGGLKLSTTSNSNATNITVLGNTVIVAVDSLSAVDSNSGGTFEIKVGMILTSYVDTTDTTRTLNGGHTDADPPLIIWKIFTDTGTNVSYLFLTGYAAIMHDQTGVNAKKNTGVLNYGNVDTTFPAHIIYANNPKQGTALIFEQPVMNGLSQYSCNRLNCEDAFNMGYGLFDPLSNHIDGIPGIMPVSYHMEIVEEIIEETDLPTNPAIWETEPKENTELDIYYEASGYHNTRLTLDTIQEVIPRGSDITHTGNPNSFAFSENAVIVDYGFLEDPNMPSDVFPTNLSEGMFIQLGFKPNTTGVFPLIGGQYIVPGDTFDITKPDGTIIRVTVKGYFNIDTSVNRADSFFIEEALHGPQTHYVLDWHNCYSFGNGVESNRIRDGFNLSQIINGVKASTTISEPYQEQYRKHGLIYSGIYNDIGGVNNLNQFVAAEKITKDLNPTYGSIQKLHTRDTDLIALCEDKVLQILATKDALFNADGNPQLVSTNRVLGQARPFVGEYGISKNPESFASESYRVYFADKVRGKILRLSKDGLTPVSDAGMSDWFKDNLKLNRKLIGSYDDKKKEYNITLPDTENTVSYKETTKGWVSFKSFILENGISCANEYFTVKTGTIFQHHYVSNIPNPQLERNIFYNRNVVCENIGPHPVTGLIGTHLYFDETRFIDSLLPSVKATLPIVGSGNAVTVENQTFVTTVFRNNVMIYDSIDCQFFGAQNPNSIDGLARLRFVTGVEEFQFEIGDVFVVEDFTISPTASSATPSTLPFRYYTNSSFNVFVNEAAGSIKSYHTLDYEGSQAFEEDYLAIVNDIEYPNEPGIDGQYFFLNELEFNRLVEQTNTVLEKLPNEDTLAGDSMTQVLQYRGDELVWQGRIRLFNNATIGFHGRKLDFNVSAADDFELGDFISLKKFNTGWFVSSVKTDQQEGSLVNFVEKEGKWFNYIKGSSNITEDIFPSINSFAESSVQGIGYLKRTVQNQSQADDLFPNDAAKATVVLTRGWNSYENIIEFDNPINNALEIGDMIYYQNSNPSIHNSLEPNQVVAFGIVAEMTEFTITVNENVFAGNNAPDPWSDMFILFAKNNIVNSSSLLGYYADIKFENNSYEKAELFSVGTEVTESSK